MKLMRQLTWCACKYNFTFSAKHVPDVKNNLADSLSRLQIDKFRQLAPQAAIAYLSRISNVIGNLILGIALCNRLTYFSISARFLRLL
jgi:hypothetical protein